MVTKTSLHPGQPVRTMDGKELGRIKEIGDRYFKVDVRLRPDYWLACDQVIAAEEAAMVGFTKDALDTYKVGRPDGVDDDAVERRVAAQRDRLERDLLNRF